MSTFLDVATPGRPEIFGTESSNEEEGVNDASLTIAHTVDAGTELLVVRAHGWTSASGVGYEVSSIVWDAAGVNEALTRAVKGSANRPTTEIWYLVNPTAKTATITITYSDTNQHEKFAHACNVRNVDTADPIGGTLSDGNTTGTAESGTLTTETAEPLIIAAATWETGGTAPSWTAPFSSRYAGNSGATASDMAYTGAEDATQVTVGNKTVALTGGANDHHTVCAVEIRGA